MGIETIAAIGTALAGAGSIVGAIKGPPKVKGPAAPAPIEAAKPAPFEPTRPEAKERPESLSELAAFSPTQERTALATRGVQIGLGQQEQDYYKNLLQRSLVGEGRGVTQQENFLAPIESQYFSRQGIGTSNVMDFLKGSRG